MRWPFTKPAEPAPERINLDALVVPRGSTAVLRAPDSMSLARRAELRVNLNAWAAEHGVAFVVLDGEWEACVVTGAPE